MLPACRPKTNFLVKTFYTYSFADCRTSSNATIHDYRFAGLLTYSIPISLPTPYGAVAKSYRHFTEITAAGLSGTFTQFPFDPHSHVVSRAEQSTCKDRDYSWNNLMRNIKIEELISPFPAPDHFDMPREVFATR